MLCLMLFKCVIGRVCGICEGFRYPWKFVRIGAREYCDADERRGILCTSREKSLNSKLSWSELREK